MVMTRWSQVALVLACLLARAADAGTISISITSTAEVTNGKLQVKVLVKNSGDEAAQSVTPLLRFHGQEVRGTGKPQLEPNASTEQTLSLPADNLGNGRWPFSVAVDYTDAASWPFQAMHAATITVGSPPPAKVGIEKIAATTLAGAGTIDATIANLSANERKVTPSVIVPEGLEAKADGGEMTLAAWEKKPLSVPLVNRTAKEGSRYPVFVVLEYDDADAHQALVSSGVVEIEPPPSYDRQRQFLYVGAGVLIALWIATMLVRVVRRQPA
jgi:hypothetical protein